MRVNEGVSVSTGENWRLRLAGALLKVQSMGFGCGGLLTLIYAVVILAVALTSGLQYLILALAAAAVAAALCGFAAALWALARDLRLWSRWTLFVVATEIVLTLVGSILFGLESTAQTTNNPFSEGGAGFTSLFGILLAACGTVVLLVLLWESASRRTQRPKR